MKQNYVSKNSLLPFLLPCRVRWAHTCASWRDYLYVSKYLCVCLSNPPSLLFLASSFFCHSATAEIIWCSKNITLELGNVHKLRLHIFKIFYLRPLMMQTSSLNSLHQIFARWLGQVTLCANKICERPLVLVYLR